MTDPLRLRRTAAVVAALVLLMPTWSGEAHEIPADVTIQAFVQPAGGTLRMLIRVPLLSMRDYDFPVRDPGYLEIAEADVLVRESAEVWIADYISMLENEEALGRPIVAAVRVAIPGDRAFLTWEGALANVRSDRLSDGIELPPQQAMLDVLLEKGE